MHTPVKARDCVACHNPHASSHGKLLSAEPAAVCASCHGDVAPKTGARSVHKPAADNRCSDCHDPHSSDFKYNLVRGGSDLCAKCHAALVAGATSAKHKHRPVENGCLTLPRGARLGHRAGAPQVGRAGALPRLPQGRDRRSSRRSTWATR